jgi:hypothetical protein
MFYRVVMQGRPLGGADLDEVKQHFVRVTGLPARVAEQLFTGIPQVIKRKVPQSDAERIAATLRAIGAAATVERELPGAEDDTSDEVVVPALHLGPPTVVPGTEAASQDTPSRSQSPAWLHAVRDNWKSLAGGTLLVAGAILLAPMASDFIASLKPAPTPPPKSAARAAPPVAAASGPVLNATLLHGPWRCIDQRTGAVSYWNYGADGALTFHGDAFKDGVVPPVAATGPTAWKLEGAHLVQTYAQRAPDTYTVGELSLMRLRYESERAGLDIQCRRP